ncbi:MAG: hypothetical protein RR221_05260 [Alistipes sp.]
MKKINLFVAVFAALAVVSCQTQDELLAPVPDNGEPISVNLKIGSGDLSTRTIEAPTDLTKITLSDGLVFFIDGNGYVVNAIALNKTEIQSVSGQTFTGVKSTAKTVLIAANLANYTDLTTRIAALTTKAAIQNTVTAISNTVIAPENTIMTNVAETTPSIPDPFDGVIRKTGETYAARVLLAPLFARIQIADVKSNDPAIVSYKLEGVYVDNYYASFYLATNKGGAPEFKTVGLDASLLGTFTPTTFFDITSPAVACDIDKKVTAVMAKAGSLPGSLWAYNVTPTIEGANKTPRVIVKISNLVVKNPIDGTNLAVAGTKYLTVKSFVSGSTPVTDFVVGNVYNVLPDTFLFKLTDLGDTPNAANINVVVYVKIKPWALVPVTPQL